MTKNGINERLEWLRRNEEEAKATCERLLDGGPQDAELKLHIAIATANAEALQEAMSLVGIYINP